LEIYSETIILQIIQTTSEVTLFPPSLFYPITLTLTLTLAPFHQRTSPQPVYTDFGAI